MPRDLFADQPPRDLFADGPGNPPAAKPDFTPGRWAGLTARNLVQGAAAFPATLMDIPAEGYNLGADAIQGKDKGFRFNEMNQNVAAMLDKTGLPRPETSGEQIGSTVAQSVVGAGTGSALGRVMQGVGGPVASGVGQTMAANPGKALTSSVLGGGAVAGAQQAGLPWWAQAAAGAAAGSVPFGRPGGLVSGGQTNPAELRALTAGYKLPPATMENPSVLSRLLGGWSGKIKTQQAASAANQDVTNGLAAKELGLPNDTTLDDNVFSGVRAAAGKAYKAVRAAVPVISTDDAFKADVAKLGEMNSELAKEFPELVKNDQISDLAETFAKKGTFSTGAGMDAIRTLRATATKNFQAIGDPQRTALAFAQRQAADALEDLIERNITPHSQALWQHMTAPDAAYSGEPINPNVFQEFQAARQIIAKSHDIEAATNPATGDVSAAKIAQLANKRPLSGGLSSIAHAGAAFPKATQMPAKFGGVEPLSVLDLMTASAPVAVGAMSGRLGEGAAIGATALSRPLARSLILSDAYQKALRSPGPAMIAPQSAAQVLPLNAALARSLQQ